MRSERSSRGSRCRLYIPLAAACGVGVYVQVCWFKCCSFFICEKKSKRYSPIDNFESTTLKFSVISPAFKESKPQGSASDCAALSFIVCTVEYDSFDWFIYFECTASHLLYFFWSHLQSLRQLCRTNFYMRRQGVALSFRFLCLVLHLNEYNVHR